MNKIRLIYNHIRDNHFWKKLLKNMFSAFVGETGSAALMVITTVIIISTIGEEAHGMFVLAQSYMIIVDGLINFQSWQAVIKYGSENIERKDYASLSSTIKMGMTVDLVTAIIGAVIAILVIPFISKALGWGPVIQKCAALFCVEIFFHFYGACTGVLRLFNKFNLVAIQKIVMAVIKLCVVMWCKIAGVTELTHFVGAYVFADIIGLLMLTIMAIITIHRSKIITIKGVMTASVKTYRKKFWGFAFWTNLSSSLDLPVKQLDVFILSALSYEIVSVYKVYKQIGSILVQLSTPLSQAIMPQFSELVAQGKTKECYNIMLKIRKAVLTLMLPITIVVTAVSPWVLRVFFGEIYGKYFYILGLYLLSRTFALSYVTIHQLFVSMGKVRENFLYVAIANGTYLILAFFLTREIGIIGIVISLFVEYYIIIMLKKRSIKRELDI